MLKITQTQLQFILLWFTSVCALWSQAPSVNADFHISPTGALTYSIPIAVPSHTLGVFPNLALTYNSQAGDGIAGYGWNLGGLSSITRMAATPHYDNLNDPADFDLNDRFAIDGQRLILESGSYGTSGSSYRTENYSNVKIQAYGTSSFGSWYGPSYFIVTQPDGTRYYYGAYFNSRSKLEWSLCRIIDTQGNKVDFSYTLVNETLRLNNITDSEADIAVSFTYETKDNALPIGIGGTLFRNDRILTRINVNIGWDNYNTYELNHSNTSSHFSRLDSVKQTSCESGAIPTITFNYQGADNQYGEYSGNFGRQIGHSAASTVKSGDINGDEIADYLFYNKDREKADYKGIFVKQGNKTGSFTTLDSFHENIEFEEAFFVKYIDISGKLQKNDGILVVNRSGASNKFYFDLYTMGGYSMGLHRRIEWLAPTVKSTGEIVASTSYIASAEIPEITYKVADFNGDGVSDIVPVTEGGTYTKTECYTDCSGDPTGPLPYPLTTPTTNPVQAIAGPTTNRILPDCERICDTSTYYNWSQFYFISLEPSYNAENNINESKGLGTYTDKNYSIADVNADGYPDIYYRDRTWLYSRIYDPINNKFTGGKTIYLEKDKPVYPGDYNGDGKTDFAQPKANESYAWYFYINNGKGFTTQEKTTEIYYREPITATHNFDPLVSEPFSSFNAAFQFMYIPVDYNKDGKTDIIRHSIAVPVSNIYTSPYSKQWIQFYKNDSEYVSETGFVNFALEESRIKSNEGKPWSGHPINADLNHLNLSNQYAYAEESGLITIHSYEGDHKAEVTLNKVTNNGLTTNINYASLGDDSVKLAAGSLDYNAKFPYNTIGSAKDFKLVANVNQTISGQSRTKYYRYGNLVTEAKGVGFLGFGSMANTNWTGNNIATLWNVATYDIYKRHAVKAAMVTKNGMKTEGTIDAEFNKTGVLSKTFYEYEYSLNSDKSYSLLTKNTEHTDVLTGVQTETALEYDEFNNVLSEIQTNDDGGVTTSLTYYNNPSGANQNYYIGRPKAKTVTKRLGTESFTTYENYTYSSNLLKTLQTRANNGAPLTETYTHDSFGNILTTTLSGVDFTSRVTSKTYDIAGRYVKTATDIQGFITKYDYDTYGRLIKETDPFNKSQSFAYDDYHRLTKQTDYLGNTISTSYYNYSSGAVRTTTTSSLGGLSYSYVNRLGWEYFTINRDDLNTNVYTYTYYNPNGSIQKKSTPYKSTANRLWDEYFYDDYNRPYNIQRFNGQTVNTTYSGLTVSVNDGTKTVSSTQDAMGNKVSVTDPGGTINYKYYANNTPKETIYGTHKITTKIDDWGRKIELNDPAAGKYTYRYDSLGNLKNETTPKGYTNYNYDKFGRESQKYVWDGVSNNTINYSYNAQGLISSINATLVYGRFEPTRNFTYTYEYDPSNQRLLEVTEDNSLAFYNRKLTYNNNGTINTETISSKLVGAEEETVVSLKNKYHNTSGAFIGVIDSNTNKILWEAKAQDAFGNYTSMSLGNDINKANTYNNYGLPTSFIHKSGTVTALDYKVDINEQTGNVSSRHNSFFTGEENFQYDNLDRLKSISGAITETQTYNTDGNIKVNPQVGTYNYDPITKYRVAGIDLNTNGQNYYKDHTPQKITYNSFKKPISIHEEGNGRVDFEYGPLMNRSVAYYGGEDTKRKIEILPKYILPLHLWKLLKTTLQVV